MVRVCTSPMLLIDRIGLFALGTDAYRKSSISNFVALWWEFDRMLILQVSHAIWKLFLHYCIILPLPLAVSLFHCPSHQWAHFRKPSFSIDFLSKLYPVWFVRVSDVCWKSATFCPLVSSATISSLFRSPIALRWRASHSVFCSCFFTGAPVFGKNPSWPKITRPAGGARIPTDNCTLELHTLRTSGRFQTKGL